MVIFFLVPPGIKGLETGTVNHPFVHVMTDYQLQNAQRVNEGTISCYNNELRISCIICLHQKYSLLC